MPREDTGEEPSQKSIDTSSIQTFTPSPIQPRTHAHPQHTHPLSLHRHLQSPDVPHQLSWGPIFFQSHFGVGAIVRSESVLVDVNKKKGGTLRFDNFNITMGPKKKVQDDDDSTEKLMRIYRKKCEELGVNPSKLLRTKIEEALEGDTPHLKKLMFWQEVGMLGTQAIFDTFCEQGGYKHLEVVILSNLKTYDEGLKSLCKYMETSKTIKEIELEINQITPIGCLYLGNALSPRNMVPTTKLNLSYNKFGSEGVKNLAKGLGQNGTLEQLVLNGCGIDYEGSFYLQEILSYHDSKIEHLSLINNQLKNEGVYQLFRALEANEALSQLYIGNNQFGQSEEIPVIEKIQEVLRKNSTLIYINMDGNGIYNSSAAKFITLMKEGNPLLLIEFGVLANKEVMDDFKKLLKKRKKKKKKKKKKKGKKKKK